MQGLTSTAQEQVLAATSAVVERAIDNEINKLDNIMQDEDELLKLRKQRLADMRKDQEKKTLWKKLGHGTLQETNDPKDFFKACEVQFFCLVVCLFVCLFVYLFELQSRVTNQQLGKHTKH
jgi:hypothetical protein